MKKDIELSIEKSKQIDNLVKNQYSNILGLAISKDDGLIYEKYYGAKMDDYNLASVTKSILSILIGIAIDKGYIESVNSKVMDFFPEYTFNDSNIIRNQITIENLLTMTAPFPFPNMQEPLSRMCRQKSWLKYSLEILGTGGRIGTFKYSTAGAHILSALITKATGITSREFANFNLFRPLGIEEILDYPMNFDPDHIFGDKISGWVTDPDGYSSGGWGLRLSLVDLIKIGQLCLNGGSWNGQQIVSSEWLKKSFNPNLNNYGYLWWIGNSTPEYMAIGSGGNLLYINCDLNLVVAIVSKIIPKPKDRQNLIKLILNLVEAP